MTPTYPTLIHALKLAIPELQAKRRRDFAAGEHAYQQGLRSVAINRDGVTGVSFGFAEDGHKSYQEYTEAIQEPEDWIEILQDPGVVVDKQMELFERSEPR